MGLLFFELITPGGFYFLFFGLSAFVVALLAGLDVGPDWLLFLVFSVVSVLSLLLFRGPLMRRFKSSERTGHPVDSIAGEIAILKADLPARAQGQAELRGTVWNAENASDQAMRQGERCRVQRVDGLKLIVVPE